MIRVFSPRNRRSPRLDGFDYTQRRWYFITICTAHRQPFFGELCPDGVALSDIGVIVEEEWLRTAEVRDDIILDEFVVMPDHFHALVGPSYLLDARGQSVTWQRSFHDSIMRNDRHFRRVRAYIKANSQRDPRARCPAASARDSLKCMSC